MTQQKHVEYWRTSAVECRQVALDNAKKHPDWALFFWHLAIEKLLKGILVKHDVVPPPTHDLVKLFTKTGLKMEKEQLVGLKEITTYNIEARYDDYKRSFYHKATNKKYTQQWVEICQEIYLWVLKNL